MASWGRLANAPTVGTLPFLVFDQVSCTSDPLLPVVLTNTGVINGMVKETKAQLQRKHLPWGAKVTAKLVL